MTHDDLTEDVAEVGGDGEIAPVVPLFDRKARPLAVHAAAAHAAANHQHRVAVAVIGPAVAVLIHGAAKLRHRQHDRVRHAIAEVGDERGDAAREVVEAAGELALCRALVDVRVPAAEVGERDLEADVRFGQLRDLPERLAERAAWIVGAVLGLVLRRIGHLEHLDRVERLTARAVQHAIGRGGVLRFERRADHVARLAGADAELADLVDRECGRRARQHARQLRRQRDGAERRRRLDAARLQVPVQPAVLRALHARRARLHVVLRVEVRPGRVGRPAGVDDCQIAPIPERLERLQARVEAEETIEIERGVLSGARLLNRDAGPGLVVLGFAERHDDVQAVGSAALEDRDELLGARRASLRERRAREERRREADAHEGEGAVLEEDSAGNHTALHGHNPLNVVEIPARRG